MSSLKKPAKLAVAVSVAAGAVFLAGFAEDRVFASGSTHEIIGVITSDSDAGTGVVFDLSNKGNTGGISESGSFQAASGQILTLEIVSGVSGGFVEFFLFEPGGGEHRFTIGETPGVKREIDLTAGTWAYNASGTFNGGSVSIKGTVSSGAVAHVSVPATVAVKPAVAPQTSPAPTGTYGGNTQPRAWSGYGVYNGGYDESPASLSQSEADRRAEDIIWRTGNWKYVEPYLPYLSADSVRRVVNMFNSKHSNPAEHKNANNYLN